MNASTRWLPALAAGLLVAASTPAIAAEDVGRVVAVRGHVTAQAPGEPERKLDCNDPIYAGDRIVSAEAGGLGIMSDGVYSGLNEKTTVDFRTTAEGAPALSLQRGHLRVLDAAGEEPARIETPGLLASNAGDDTEAIVFPEKAGTVSMVCPWEDPVGVARVLDPAVGTRPDPGQCAIDKPKEPLFLAEATHPKLGVINDHCTPVAGLIGQRFLPDVAAGPPMSMPAVGPPINSNYNVQDLRQACDQPGTCGALGAGGGGPGGGGPPGGGPTVGKGGFICIAPPGGAC